MAGRVTVVAANRPAPSAMRVFVFTPIYRLEPETVGALMALEHDGPLALYLQRDNPHPSGNANITHQYQAGRRAFLASDYDAMLVVESDIIPPPDAIRRLADLRADVAYGHYQFRTTPISNVYERYPGQPRNEGESLSLNPKKYKAARRAGRVVCSGAGLGCVLIQRHVLERFDFRDVPGDGGSCDVWFNRDVLRAGMIQRADMDLVCGHKDEQGRIRYPRGYAVSDGHDAHIPAPAHAGQ